MQITVTVGALAPGAMVTQYGKRAPVTLDPVRLRGWTDDTTPRTDKPVRLWYTYHGADHCHESAIVR